MNNIQQLTQQFLEDVFSSPEYADILFNYDTSSRSYYAIREVSQRFTVLVSDLLSLTSDPNYESIYNAVKAIHVTNKQYHDPKNASLQIICDLVLSKVPSIENRNNDLRVNGILEYLKTGRRPASLVTWWLLSTERSQSRRQLRFWKSIAVLTGLKQIFTMGLKC